MPPAPTPMPALARTVLLAAAAALLAIQADADARAADLPEKLGSDARFTEFLHLIDRAGLTDWLRSRSGFTVFAPTNRAFAAKPSSVRVVIRPVPGDDSRTSQGRLQRLVRGHVLTTTLPPSALIGRRRTFTAADGTRRIIDGTEAGVIAIRTAPAVRTGGAKPQPSRTSYVFGRMIAADNGIIYPIDRVLAE